MFFFLHRVCVQVLLPAEEHFRVDARLVNIPTTTSSVARREALHVQSTSYWAPANIGPYSQAVKVIEIRVSFNIF